MFFQCIITIQNTVMFYGGQNTEKIMAAKNLQEFDFIVIGSGFGGSVMTCRMAEKGYSVCLLERGKRYGMWEFPRQMEDIRKKFFYDPDKGLHGVAEFNAYRGSDAISVRASGLGGGSLIYASMQIRMPAQNFYEWPAGITRETLDPYYDKVADMLEVSPYPEDHSYYSETPKAKIMKEVSEKMPKIKDQIGDCKFIFPDIAVRFEGKFPGEQSPNKQGVLQSSCNKCGECFLGCNIHSKNSLDLNYLARATNTKLMGKGSKAAEIRTGANVLRVEPLAKGGYKVIYKDPEGGGETVELKSRRVVLSAGSIGSAEILLKMQKEGVMDQLSPCLGQGWSANGDLEGTIVDSKYEAYPTMGPTITAGIEFDFQPYPDGFPHWMIVQDGGFPNFLMWYAAGKAPSLNVLWQMKKLLWAAVSLPFKKLLHWLGLKRLRPEINIGDEIVKLIDGNKIFRKSLVLLGMGRDRSDGYITLNKKEQAIIKYKIKQSELHYDRARKVMKAMAKTIKGTYLDNPLTYLRKIIAVHPLGGCCMGDSPETGVIDGNGEVYGYKGLYVVDGSIIPSATGPNPSMTIAAMAERIAEKIPIKK